MRRFLLIVTIVTSQPFAAEARQAVDSSGLGPSVPAVRTGEPPMLDGRLIDAVWLQAPVIDGFTQRDPDEGEPASQITEVRILYDDDALYVGARLNDDGPVTSRLGRRDMDRGSSDWFGISLDSFYDRRTAFQFGVNPAGVRRDAALTAGSRGGRGGGGGGGGGAGGGGAGGGGGGNLGGPDGDLAWDAVWEAATSVDDGGWTAELKIPFSQLRFGTADDQVWGLQLERIIHRQQEHSQFSFTPKSERGGIPAYGELRNLQGLTAGRPLELMPYVLGQAQPTTTSPIDAPASRNVSANMGLDLRYRLTSNLTLTATANPDFGQVEVDPAVINLTAFETRFEERRPFFVEGSTLFAFGGAVTGAPQRTAGSLLYTRRMGRAPQIDADAEAVDVPAVTTIIGAAKLSGKTSNGWSIGVLNVVTGREQARFLDGSGLTRESVAEPRANHVVARVSRELAEGRTVIGGLATSVQRDLSDPTASATLRAGAYTGGFDFLHEFADRSWILTGFLAGSRVSGAPAAIRSTQESSTHYFQRPDAGHVSLDNARTSLGGSAATVQLRKVAGEHWRSDTWLQLISPGFETNDIGFLQRADRRAFGQSLWYWERTPGRFLREWRLINSLTFGTNYGGDVIDHRYQSQLSLTHLNYWEFEVSAEYEPRRTDDWFTRGGPLAKRPATWQYGVALQSDPRRAVFGQVETRLTGDAAGSREHFYEAIVNLRTSPRWNLSVGPNVKTVRQHAQYVDDVDDSTMTATYGRRYVFAPLRQTEVSLVTRLNYSFSPDITVELYVQPLVADGRYGAPMEFQRPREYEFLTYGRDLGTLNAAGGSYLVDPDGTGPVSPFVVDDPSFTTRSLRGNAVFRWEYRPGSTLYVVWQQERLNDDPMRSFSAGRAFRSLLDTRSNNTFVVKWTYWLNP